jgi:uncharacterized protein (TIGR02996 family)
MTRDEGLLQAIQDSPADDAVRLVYADWLEESGDAVHAEFIRVQCRLARLDRQAPERDPLKRRERALWKKLGARWSALLPGLRIDRRMVSRGFLWGMVERRLFVPVTTVLEHSGRWWPQLPIRLLEVGSPVEVPRQLAQGDHLPHVSELYLRVGPTSQVMPQEFVIDLLGSTRLRCLRHLGLFFIPWTRQVGEALLSSPLLDQLERLSLGHCTLRYSGGFLYPEPPVVGQRSLLEAVVDLVRRREDVFIIQPPGERDWHRCIAATKAGS